MFKLVWNIILGCGRIGFRWGSQSSHHHPGFGLQGPVRNRGEFYDVHNLLNIPGKKEAATENTYVGKSLQNC